jgi:hypothetical protein
MGEGNIMNGLQEHLQRGEALINVIERSRQETGDPYLAATIECMLIDRVIRDLESDAGSAGPRRLVPVRLRRPH